jgi:hypothetical protein
MEGAGVENAIKEISAEDIPELLMAIARCCKSGESQVLQV